MSSFFTLFKDTLQPSYENYQDEEMDWKQVKKQPKSEETEEMLVRVTLKDYKDAGLFGNRM